MRTRLMIVKGYGSLGLILMMLYAYSYLIFSSVENGEVFARFFSHNELIFSALFALVYWLAGRCLVFRLMHLTVFSRPTLHVFRYSVIPVGAMICAVFVWTDLGIETADMVGDSRFLPLVTVICLLFLADFNSMLFDSALGIELGEGKTLREKLLEERIVAATYMALALVIFVPILLISLN